MDPEAFGTDLGAGSFDDRLPIFVYPGRLKFQLSLFHQIGHQTDHAAQLTAANGSDFIESCAPWASKLRVSSTGLDFFTGAALARSPLRNRSSASKICWPYIAVLRSPKAGDLQQFGRIDWDACGRPRRAKCRA